MSVRSWFAQAFAGSWQLAQLRVPSSEKRIMLIQPAVCRHSPANLDQGPGFRPQADPGARQKDRCTKPQCPIIPAATPRRGLSSW